MDTAKDYDNRDEREAPASTDEPSLIPGDAFEKDLPEGTLGAEEEL